MGLLVIAPLVAGDYNSAAYKQELVSSVNKLDNAYKENLRLCRHFSDKAKIYLESTKDDELSDTTILNCQKKIRIYCGAIAKAQVQAN